MIQNQQHIYNVLKQNKLKDRLSHAYLFYGDDGVGKKEMAYALACLFYCEHDGCLACETCKNILEGQHLNVSYIGVLDSKKLISKEQITDLQEEFSKTSLLDGPRIYIVDGIDTASASAQNSLLKFIEEPVNNTPTIGIFIATDLANVVSTIVSRCSLIAVVENAVHVADKPFFLFQLIHKYSPVNSDNLRRQPSRRRWPGNYCPSFKILRIGLPDSGSVDFIPIQVGLHQLTGPFGVLLTDKLHQLLVVLDHLQVLHGRQGHSPYPDRKSVV